MCCFGFPFSVFSALRCHVVGGCLSLCLILFCNTGICAGRFLLASFSFISCFASPVVLLEGILVSPAVFSFACFRLYYVRLPYLALVCFVIG